MEQSTMRYFSVQGQFSRTAGLAVLVLLAIGLFAALLDLASESEVSHAQASFPIEVEGYAWSGTVGWISMNCSNDASCGNANYKVEINEDMTLSGLAWSEHVGYVQFGGLTDCPSGGNCDARLDTDLNEVLGWARACEGTDDPGDCSTMVDHDDGWDGWISLNCRNDGTCGTNNDYRVRLGTGSLWSYGWGSEVVSWVDFTPVTFDNPCTPDVSCINDANGSGREQTDQWCNTDVTYCPDGEVCSESDPTQCVGEPTANFWADDQLVELGDTTMLHYDAQNVSECTITQGTQEIGTWTETSVDVESDPVLGETVVTLTCIDLSGVEQDMGEIELRILPSGHET